MNSVGISKPVTSTFAVTVQELKNVSPSHLVAQLNELFLGITRFSADEAVAAYQTLSLLEDVLGNDEGGVVSKHLQTAILERMSQLTQGIDAGKHTLAVRFHKVTGVSTMKFL